MANNGFSLDVKFSTGAILAVAGGIIVLGYVSTHRHHMRHHMMGGGGGGGSFHGRHHFMHPYHRRHLWQNPWNTNPWEDLQHVPLRFSHMRRHHFMMHPMGRPHLRMKHLKMMIHQDILHRCKHPHQVHMEHDRIAHKINQHHIHLRPLAEGRRMGRISEGEFHDTLRNIADDITEELGIPMMHEHRFRHMDLVNREHPGSYIHPFPPPDTYRFMRHGSCPKELEEPNIQDLGARMHMAAFTTAMDNDDIAHINLFSAPARSNNVEILNDSDYQTAPSTVWQLPTSRGIEKHFQNNVG